MRNAEVYPNDVLTILKRDKKSKRSTIATELDCCVNTISRKVTKLVEDGENIGWDGKGYIYLEADNGDGVRAWNHRIFHSLKRWAKQGKNHKPVAIEARKRFGKELTRDERSNLKQELLLITRVIDAVDLDEDLET